MLEVLKERKDALEAQGKKGFTLMEMLIVIAIIAVLVAIAIPIFTAQLENSREATDKSNIRSAYAELAAAYLTTGETQTVTIPVTQTQENWQSDNNAVSTKIGTDIKGVDDTASAYVLVSAQTTGNYTLTVDSSGNIKYVAP